MKITCLLMAIAGIALSIAARAAAPATPTIAKFFGDKAGAISFTFDDGSQNQMDLAVPMLNEFGIKATFFVITGPTRDSKSEPYPNGMKRDSHCAVSWEEWREAARMGHEIANHSLTHARLVIATPEQLAEQVYGSAKLFTEKMGFPPLTFCYPGNGKNPAVREFVLLHHIASRDTCVTYGGKDFTVNSANAVVDRAINENTWLTPMIHGIDDAYSPIDHDVLRQHMAYAISRSDVLWIDTFVNVNRYLQERDSAVLTVTTHTKKSVEFTLTCPLDPKRYTMPLTVVIPVEKAKRVKAARDGQDARLPVTVAPGKILVDVLPGSGTIKVQWK